ncbi:RNA-directed DNA polymerase, eukaryota, Reverse transcriptase zinc-binding domain protein [Artemisia annua]|uniref:RNA-directed DNA polymerase, eukaryota, Reverse transcriptase zinc-binding domain protein n=1 Tax=Artemisia annua TaxID=35608 RepID=A0A2U1LD10_ARTAN|nr:RNA-directed DNA polymerase, eukaryota, Reverse transcriptase zinc-binding domain protein [Artemisia annua]
MVDKFTKRLSLWKENSLSIGGRFTLTKSVLGSLPLYYLSLYRARNKVMDALERVRIRFFWGFKEGEKGLTWVKWKTVLASFDLGGLGVGSIKAKNLSLLGKWWWRFRCEKHALWCKVIASIHGADGGFSTTMGASLK